VNDAAQAWLDAQTPTKDPNPVTISLNGANIDNQSGQPIQAGDDVEVEATTDTSGTHLIAVNVHADTPAG
jgi:hypothetical protein